MSTPKRQKCSSESGRHTWKHFRNKVVRTQTFTSIRLTEKGIYGCTVCKLAKYGAPVYEEEGASADGQPAPETKPETQHETGR